MLSAAERSQRRGEKSQNSLAKIVFTVQRFPSAVVGHKSVRTVPVLSVMPFRCILGTVGLESQCTVMRTFCVEQEQAIFSDHNSCSKLESSPCQVLFIAFVFLAHAVWLQHALLPLNTLMTVSVHRIGKSVQDILLVYNLQKTLKHVMPMVHAVFLRHSKHAKMTKCTKT
jgi:hypothetical protein